MLSRQFKPQLPVQMNNYGASQEQPIITSQSLRSSPFTQQGTVNTNQQIGQSFNQQQQQPSLFPQQQQPSLFPQQQQSPLFTQQMQSSFIPQQTQPSLIPQQMQSSFIPQQPVRSFNRVFQPEQTRNRDIQPTSSGYRR